MTSVTAINMVINTKVISLTNSGRFLTDWAGAGSAVTHAKLSLGVPNYPGDHIVIAGRVENVGEEEGVRIAEVAYQGTNGLGPHVTGTAKLALP